MQSLKNNFRKQKARECVACQQCTHTDVKERRKCTKIPVVFIIFGRFLKTRFLFPSFSAKKLLLELETRVRSHEVSATLTPAGRGHNSEREAASKAKPRSACPKRLSPAPGPAGAHAARGRGLGATSGNTGANSGGGVNPAAEAKLERRKGLPGAGTGSAEPEAERPLCLKLPNAKGQRGRALGYRHSSKGSTNQVPDFQPVFQATHLHTGKNTIC